MKIKVIKTEEEYNAACERVYNLIQSELDNIEPDSLKGEELELLSLLIEDYEKRMNYKLNNPNPIDVIKTRMQERNLKQADMLYIFGSKSTASKILNKKRELSLDMIRKINRELEIPVNLLIGI